MISERRFRLRKKFGITLETYNQLLESQGGVCAVCLKRPSAGDRQLAVDHCHETGRVRGLLCIRCNTALGALGDSLGGVHRLVDYLCRRAGLAARPAWQSDAQPRLRTVVRYVDPAGRRSRKGEPGAVAVREKTRTYFAKVAGRVVSLRTADEAEARRRLAAMMQRAAG